MIAVCGDIAPAILDQRFAKIPRQKDPEESRAISAGREDSRCDDLLQWCRRAHANSLQAHWRFAVNRRAEWASPRHVRQDRALTQTQRKPALPEEETNVRRFRRKAR